MNSRQEAEYALALLQEKARRAGQQDMLAFTHYTMSRFDPAKFHKKYYSYLTDFAEGRICKLMVFMPPQHGKLLPADTPVLTTKGWKSHGELQPGDYVFGDDGKPKKVLRNFGVIDWNVERLVFASGVEMLAAKEHLWKIHVDYDDHKGRREIITETQHIFNRRHKRNPYVRSAPALTMPEVSLPIDPYLLGCWLGDGISRQGVIISGKQDAEHFAQLGECREVKGGYFRTLIPGLSKALRENNLILNKHIPIPYILASKEQREALLQGLMDTDGTVDSRGNCEFTQMEGKLADDVYTLLRTLGYKPTKNTYVAKLNGKEVGRKTRVLFNPDWNDQVFRLPRKAQRLRNKKFCDREDKYKFFLREIKPHGVVKGNCIQVEGGMYLAGPDLIPTHNSEGSTRRLPAFILGKDPDTRIAVVSYNSPKARKFNREVQRVIDTPEYRELFPGTTLNKSNVVTIAGQYVRNADEFEIVNRLGGVKTVGVGGPLTGDPVDVLIMDDLYKDAMAAWSPTIRERVNDWYDTVAETRLHNDSRQLIVFTRWHEEDLAGRLIAEQGEYDPIENPNGWVIVTFKAIKEGEPTDYDPRLPGEALWPERHSLEKLEAVRSRNPHVFESLYQQNPQPQEGLMYEYGFGEYEVLPDEQGMIRRNVTDTADSGSNFFCSICYIETKTACYVTDILFTNKNTDYTKPKMAEMLKRNGVQQCLVEANNGGKEIGNAVKLLCIESGYKKVMFHSVHQTENKELRIRTKAPDVQNIVKFPKGWQRKWPDFYNQLKSHRYVNAYNKFDDAADGVTYIAEFFQKRFSNFIIM